MRALVSGTGTDVGKTHVTACLLAYARDRGLVVDAWKPIASGVSSGIVEDAEAHARAKRAPIVAPAYALAAPISPHLAARREGVVIDLDRIGERARELEPRGGLLLVEGAGGLFSPITEGEGHVELLSRLAPAKLLLVASDRLGVLHDVRATLLGAAAFGVTGAVVVLSAPAVADASTGSNAAELARLGVVTPAAVFPRADVEAESSFEAAALTLRALGVTAGVDP